MPKTLRLLLVVLLILALLPMAATPALAQVTVQAPPGAWLAQYWNGMDMSAPPIVERVEPAINHDWGTGSPDSRISADNFSARWTGSFVVDGGTYRLKTRTDDGVRVRVDGALVIDDWIQHSATERVHDMALAAGVHSFVVEYFAAGGAASAYFDFTNLASPPGTATANIAPTSGPAGTVVQVSASGYWPYAQVTVSVVPQGSAPVSSHVQAANASGQLWTSVTIPTWATNGSKWLITANNDATTANSPVFTVGGTATTSPCGSRYVVQPGDWFYQIARTCQVSVTDLLRVNPQVTNPSRIVPGQVLNIPPVGTPPALPATVVAVTQYNLNFRTGPSTGHGVIATIPAGTRLTVIARGPSGWIYVRYGSNVGWVAGWLTNITGNLAALPYRTS